MQKCKKSRLELSSARRGESTGADERDLNLESTSLSIPMLCHPSHPSLLSRSVGQWLGMEGTTWTTQLPPVAALRGGLLMARGKPCRSLPCLPCPPLRALPLERVARESWPGLNLLTVTSLWLAHSATAPAGGGVGRRETGRTGP
jgi:hypothetical protein